MKVESHKDLAEFIAGKSVLHMNSLGKDSVVCLEWLARYAKPSRIVSVFFKHMAEHPDDDRYLAYLSKRYPHVEFIVKPNAHELTNIEKGDYQSPIEMVNDINKWEHYGFSMHEYAEELRASMGLDFRCVGQARYESIARATGFHKNGLVQGNVIYPIGLMSKAEVFGIIRSTGLKVHPSYRFAKGTFDYPSYYKMRRAFIANPKYRENVLRVFPLLRLDEFRYERLFNAKK